MSTEPTVWRIMHPDLGGPLDVVAASEYKKIRELLERACSTVVTHAMQTYSKADSKHSNNLAQEIHEALGYGNGDGY
jgi:hypothetical protein